MKEEFSEQFDELWDDANWGLLRDDEVLGGFVIYHVKASVLKHIDDPVTNQALCERLHALGRPVVDDLPPIAPIVL
jgi:hypothetical protein